MFCLFVGWSIERKWCGDEVRPHVNVRTLAWGRVEGRALRNERVFRVDWLSHSRNTADDSARKCLSRSSHCVCVRSQSFSGDLSPLTYLQFDLGYSKCHNLFFLIKFTRNLCVCGFAPEVLWGLCQIKSKWKKWSFAQKECLFTPLAVILAWH